MTTSSWLLIDSERVNEVLAERWADYNKALNSDHPALHPLFVQRLHRYFSTGKEMLAVAPDAIALLQPDGFGRWSTFLPSQSCAGPILVSPTLSASDIQNLILSLCKSLPGVTTMLSCRLQDERIAQIKNEQVGAFAATTVYGQTTDVCADGDFEEFWNGRSKSLRRSVRRRFQKAEQDGFEISLSRIDDPGQIRGGIDTYASLESVSWKSHAGTAIDGENRQSRFYIDLLQTFAELRQASIYQLLFNDVVTASLLTISSAGIMIVLKTTYDVSKSCYSPGRLLDYLTLRDVFSRDDIALIENYTVSTDEDRRWCTTAREMLDVDIFPSKLILNIVMARRKLLSRARPPT